MTFWTNMDVSVNLTRLGGILVYTRAVITVSTHVIFHVDKEVCWCPITESRPPYCLWFTSSYRPRPHCSVVTCCQWMCECLWVLHNTNASQPGLFVVKLTLDLVCRDWEVLVFLRKIPRVCLFLVVDTWLTEWLLKYRFAGSSAENRIAKH